MEWSEKNVCMMIRTEKKSGVIYSPKHGSYMDISNARAPTPFTHFQALFFFFTKNHLMLQNCLPFFSTHVFFTQKKICKIFDFEQYSLHSISHYISHISIDLVYLCTVKLHIIFLQNTFKL